MVDNKRKTNDQSMNFFIKGQITFTMIKYFTFILLTLACMACQQGGNELVNPRQTLLFNEDWRFHRGDVDSAEKVAFNDKAWRILSLPHDWSIEDIPETDSPLDPNAIGEVSAGFFVGGTSWYRKRFSLPESLKAKRIYLQFDGIYMNADIWINGRHLGNHPYGYTTFGYDVTKYLNHQDENTIAVEVKNEGKNSRWYSGSGIYRHVWLIATEHIYVPQWGAFISTPEVNKEKAEIKMSIRIKNDSDNSANVEVFSRVFNQEGILRSQTRNVLGINPSGDHELEQRFEIESPRLWSPDTPNLYKIVTQIMQGEDILDKVENHFGIRKIEFGTKQGFLLNGQPMLLKGGCIHHGNGPLGAAAYDRAEERKVELMKQSGYNAIRCAHNPPSKALLDACDRLGVMVIDEAFDMWKQPKNPDDYSNYFDEWWQQDVASMVLRDRNHPSIIMWSTGNEIPERGTPEGAKESVMLGKFIKSLDPTRPVTAAVNGLNPDKDPYFATLDISGYNYATGGDHWKSNIYQLDHDRVPDRIMYGAESYPLEAFGAWMDVVDNTFVIGDFVWTGFDYLGEASIGWLGYMQQKEFYPWSHAFCGDIDICGWKRPQSYYRDILWEVGNKPYIFITPPQPSFALNPDKMDWSKWNWHDLVDSWNWKGQEGKALEVVVYNRSELVELFINGQSLGKKPTNRKNEWVARWRVPYEPGELKAVNYDGDKILSTNQIVTATDPVGLDLVADRTEISADGYDLSYVTVNILDGEGVRDPNAEVLVNFEISGPGEILAVGSSNPMSKESYRRPYRKSYQGRCLVIVKSQQEPGEIILKAKSQDLSPAMISITSN